MRFRVTGVSQGIADEVRRTHVAPVYGHPAHLELARGTGPCRCCLRKFLPGREQRLLFTFRPEACGGALTAPGPVFVHATHCVAFAGDSFPEELRSLPLAFEARGAGGRVIEVSIDPKLSAESQIERLFVHEEVVCLHLRHAEAGCHIARIDRATPAI